MFVRSRFSPWNTDIALGAPEKKAGEVLEKLWDESIRAFVERDILRGKLEKVFALEISPFVGFETCSLGTSPLVVHGARALELGGQTGSREAVRTLDLQSSSGQR